MASWISIYCTRAVLPLDTAALRRDIATADWWTLAEDVGLRQELVRPGLDLLGLERPADDSEIALLVSYGVPGRDASGQTTAVPASWPLILRRLEPADLDEMRDSPHCPDALRAATHLEAMAFSLHAGQLSSMAVVFADELARAIAHRGRGIVEHLEGWYDTDPQYGAYRRLDG